MSFKEKQNVSKGRFRAFFRRMGYLRFGDWAERSLIQKNRFLDFQKLKKSMKQAGWETSLRGYVGMAIFAAIFACVTTAVIVSLISSILVFTGTNVTLLLAFLLLGLILSAVVPIMVFGGFVKYPSMYISGRRVQIDNSLPTVASYMSAMTSAGVPPAPIFASLAKERISKVITQEAERINRDIEILGLDILRALEMAAYRSPSERWSGFLEGMIGTVNSGGDLTKYLQTETKTFMKFKQEKTKEFIENLGVLAEIFMVVGVVTPLFFVVMIAILSILSSRGEDSVTLLVTIAYILIPILMAVQYILTSVGETGQ